MDFNEFVGMCYHRMFDDDDELDHMHDDRDPDAHPDHADHSGDGGDDDDDDPDSMSDAALAKVYHVVNTEARVYFSEEQLADFRRQFAHVDADRSGHIDEEELRDLVDHLGEGKKQEQMSDNQLSEILAQVGAGSSDGSLSLSLSDGSL